MKVNEMYHRIQSDGSPFKSIESDECAPFPNENLKRNAFCNTEPKYLDLVTGVLPNITFRNQVDKMGENTFNF